MAPRDEFDEMSSNAPPHRANQQLRKILMQNLDTSNDEEWFAFVDILTDSITRQIRSGMVPGQVRCSPRRGDECRAGRSGVTGDRTEDRMPQGDTG